MAAHMQQANYKLRPKMPAHPLQPWSAAVKPLATSTPRHATSKASMLAQLWTALDAMQFVQVIRCLPCWFLGTVKARR